MNYRNYLSFWDIIQIFKKNVSNKTKGFLMKNTRNRIKMLFREDVKLFNAVKFQKLENKLKTFFRNN